MSAKNSEVLQKWQRGQHRANTNLTSTGETLSMFGLPIGRTTRSGDKKVISFNSTNNYFNSLTSSQRGAVETIISEAMKLKSVNAEPTGRFTRSVS
jgi:hypothetical protein